MADLTQQSENSAKAASPDGSDEVTAEMLP